MRLTSALYAVALAATLPSGEAFAPSLRTAVVRLKQAMDVMFCVLVIFFVDSHIRMYHTKHQSIRF